MTSIRQALFAYLDSSPAGDISGWELFEAIARKTGRKTYPATLLEYARDYAELSGAEFACIDQEHSVYRFKPGCAIAGAIVD